jgi:hypothetical protein
MDTENNSGVPTPEELQVEQESLAVVQDDVLRSRVIDSLGLEDNEQYADLINKAVEREKSYQQKLSSAIGAKIKWREEASKLKQPSNQTQTQTKSPLDADDLRKQQETIVAERFNEEFLEDLEYSDNLKAEIRKITKLNGVSAKAATKDSYIQFLMDKETAERRTLEAAKNGSGERNGTNNEGEMPSRFNDPSYMATEAGQKDYDEWASKK